MNLIVGADGFIASLPPVEGGPPPDVSGPDLVVTDFRLTGSMVIDICRDSYVAEPGQWVAARAVVTNRGDVRAGTGIITLRVFASDDATVSPSDAEIWRTGLHGEFAPTYARTVSGSYLIPPDTRPGTYYVGACVDAVPGETDTANNCSNAVRMDVGLGDVPCGEDPFNDLQ